MCTVMACHDEVFSESASPEIIREIMALHRNGASPDELRRAYFELESMEKREMSALVTSQEREELISRAEAMDRDGNEASKTAYRESYCRIRDDVKLRQRLSRMEPSAAAAWYEADALEKSGMPPQDVAAELRSRIDPEILEILDGAHLKGHVAAKKKTEVKKKKASSAKMRRGFLLGQTDETYDALVEKARAFPAMVARRLRIPADSECERACAEAMVAFSKLAKDPTIESLTETFEAATDEVMNRTTSTAQEPQRAGATRRTDAFVDAVVRLCIVPRYEGAPLDPILVDFMLEVYERRRESDNDDEALKRDVMAHLQRHGPGFLSHMESAATLLDGLQRYYDSTQGEERDHQKTKLRRHLHSHYTLQFVGNT